MVSHYFFLTNATHAFYKRDAIYAIAFLFLTATSISVWDNRDDYTSFKFWADQFAIYLVFTIGLIKCCKFIRTTNIIIPTITISIVILLWFYTILFNNYSYHYLIHIISSIGHHAIIYSQ